MSCRRKDLLSLAALTVLVAAFFWAPLTGSAQFFHSDAHALLYPLKQLIAEELSAGRVPLWDPWSLNGSPVVASYVSAVFAPQTVLYLLLPFNAAFALSIVLKHFCGAVFEFLLLRRLGASAAAAAAGGAVFALSGPFLSLSGFHAFAPECVPLVLWLWLRVLDRRRDGRPVALPLLACVGGNAFAFLQGDLQCFFASAALGLFLPFVTAAPQARHWTRAASLWGAVLTATGLLCALQLFPSAAILPESTRAAMPREEWLRHSLPGCGILETFWPRPTASAASADFVAFRYLGFTAVLLVLLAVALASRSAGIARRAVAFFGGAMLLALLLALGENAPVLEPAASVLPVLKLFRYPEKWLLVASVAAATLAGIGVEGLRRLGLRRGAWALGGVATLDLFVAGSAFLKERLVDPRAYDAIAEARPVLTAPGFSPHDRVLRLPTNGAFATERAAGRAELIAWNVATLLGNNGSRARVRQVGGLTSFNAVTMERLSAEAVRRGRVARLMDLLAAGWILTTPADARSYRARADLDGLFGSGPPVASWRAGPGTLELHRRASALPRALVVPELLAAPDEATATEVLLSERFDSRRAAVVVAERGVSRVRPAAPGALEASVRFVDDGACRLVIEAGGAEFSGGWLLVNDTFERGWTATVNDVDAEVVRANLLARAVELPAGLSRVEMRYRPLAFRAGLWTSAAAALILCALAWNATRNERGRRDAQPLARERGAVELQL